ncbi:hypothetical protein SH449x_000953 [Pirellulaceae bacterium SH449]
MKTKRPGKASDLRQMRFDWDRPTYRTQAGAKRLEGLLRLPGVYRGSDSRFVETKKDVNTTPMRSRTK